MTLREKRKSNFDLLGSILDDPILHDMFREFTNEKHAEEILVFYLEVKQYRETEEYEKRYIHAKKIYDYFLKDGSPYQLGMITNEQRELIGNLVDKATPTLFNGIQKRVFMDMASSLLSDFMKTDKYINYLNPICDIDITLPKILNDKFISNLFEHYLQTKEQYYSLGFFCFLQKILYYNTLQNEEEKKEYSNLIYKNFLDKSNTNSIIDIKQISEDILSEIVNRLENNETEKLFIRIEALVFSILENDVENFRKSSIITLLNSTTKDKLISSGASVKETPNYLFKKLVSHGNVFKNRIGARLPDPMESIQGEAHDLHLVKAGSLLMSGIGFICIEGVAVSPNGRQHINSLGIWNDKHLEGYKRITNFAKQMDAIACIQLVHAGRKVIKNDIVNPFKKEIHHFDDDTIECYSCTQIPYSDRFYTPKILSKKNISEIITDFTRAAELAVAAGFNMIEIEAAGGFLIHQFLSPLVNTKNDTYGGDASKRIKLCVKIIKAVKRVIPSSVALVCRVSLIDPAPGGWNFDDCIELVSKLKQFGIASVVCSSGGVTPNEISANQIGTDLNFCRILRQKQKISTLTVCPSLNVLSYMNSFISKGMTDLIYVSDAIFTNPKLIYDLASEVDEPVYNPMLDNILLY